MRYYFTYTDQGDEVQVQAESMPEDESFETCAIWEVCSYIGEEMVERRLVHVSFWDHVPGMLHTAMDIVRARAAAELRKERV